MGIFRPDFNKPGPGVHKDEPRKKGTARFFEVMSRDYRDLVKLNLLFIASILPSVAFLALAFAGFLSIIMFPLSILAAFPVGSVVVAVFFCITRILRDEPGYFWDDFKRKFHENMKQAALPGILGVVFIYAQIIMLMQVMIAGEIDIVSLMVGLVPLLLFSMVAPYVFIQFAYINLGTMRVINNAFLLAFYGFKRTLMGGVLSLAPWIAIFMYFPLSLIVAPLILLFGFTVPWLWCFMWMWPHFDSQLNMEEELRKISEDNISQEGENNDKEVVVEGMRKVNIEVQQKLKKEEENN